MIYHSGIKEVGRRDTEVIRPVEDHGKHWHAQDWTTCSPNTYCLCGLCSCAHASLSLCIVLFLIPDPSSQPILKILLSCPFGDIALASASIAYGAYTSHLPLLCCHSLKILVHMFILSHQSVSSLRTRLNPRPLASLEHPIL